MLVPITAQDYTPEVTQATSGTDCIIFGAAFLGQPLSRANTPPADQ